MKTGDIQAPSSIRMERKKIGEKSGQIDAPSSMGRYPSPNVGKKASTMPAPDETMRKMMQGQRGKTFMPPSPDSTMDKGTQAPSTKTGRIPAPDENRFEQASGNQSASSPVTTPEEALSYVGQYKPNPTPNPRTGNNMAPNEPPRYKGYENLGIGGPPHTGEPYPPKVKENRGGGSA